MIIRLVILFIIVVVIKIFYNFYYYLLSKKYYKEYIKFVKTDSKSWFIRENKQKIIKLFLKAGVEDTLQPNAEPTGYGMIATGNISVFRNLSVLREDIVNIINADFREAIGIYKQRIFESFNPVYWIEALLLLPKVLFEFLGINPASLIIKIFLLIWWIIVAISTIVGILFNKEFTTWLARLIKI